jgi:hypothetical protein
MQHQHNPVIVVTRVAQQDVPSAPSKSMTYGMKRLMAYQRQGLLLHYGAS